MHLIDDILADESEPACERLVVHSLSEERVVISFRLTLSVGRAATMCLRYPNYIAVAGSLGTLKFRLWDEATAKLISFGKLKERMKSQSCSSVG